MFGAAAAILVVLSIIGGVVFSHDDSPPKPTLSTHTNTTPARLGATVKPHTLPLSTQAVVFYKKHFVPLLATLAVLVLILVGFVIAAVLLKATENDWSDQGEPVVPKENPEPYVYEQPEEPMSIGTLISFAAGVLVVGALFMFVGSRVLAQFRATSPDYINPNPREPLPSPQECLDRFQRVMRWVSEGRIKIREHLVECEFVDVRFPCDYPAGMNGYNAADLTVALNNPAIHFYNYGVGGEDVDCYDPTWTRSSKLPGGIGTYTFMDNVESYRDEEERKITFQIVKDLESRFQ